VLIRPEREEDRDAVAEVNRQAFGGDAEVRLIAAVRASEVLVPELSLVAEVDGRVAGHILLSPVTLETRDGERSVLSLAPMAVLPAHQRSGIGSALVRRAIEAAHARGDTLIVVVGHPEYYPRFGFVPATRFGLEHPFPVPDEVFMALPLRGEPPSGRIRYPPAFDAVT
jgi:putative acetyltransferase